MKTEKNYQSAEVAQASTAKNTPTKTISTTPTAQTPSTTANLNTHHRPLSSGAEAAVRIYGEQLIDILGRFSAADYMAQLLAMDWEYKELLHAIDAGGLLEREADEDPAEVLADLRRCYTPTPRQLAERANLLRCMGDLLREVEGLVDGIRNELHGR